MTDNLEDKLADLTHQFHEKYRTSGIALCISLAAVASAESWWFYGLFKDLKNTCNTAQILLWYIVISSAVLLFASSFVLQFYHYYGMKQMAQSFFHAYKLRVSPTDETSRTKMDEQWKASIRHFTNADRVLKGIIFLTVINFLSAMLYIAVYQPNKS